MAGPVCPPRPHPLAPSPLRGEGERNGVDLAESGRFRPLGPPSPRSGEGPRVRLRRADRPRGNEACDVPTSAAVAAAAAASHPPPPACPAPLRRPRPRPPPRDPPHPPRPPRRRRNPREPP